MVLKILIEQILIIAGVIALFLIVSYLNVKTKVPKDAKLPEKCQFCPSKTCVIKTTEIAKKQEELKEYLQNCEENDESETQ